MNENNEYGLFVKKVITTKKDGSESVKYSLIDQSLAAEKLEKIVKNNIAWDPVKMDWRMFKDNAWIDAEEGYAERKISEILRGEMYSPSGRIGCSDAWWNGVVNLMKKSGIITRPKDRDGVIPFQNGILVIEKIGEEDCLIDINQENAMSWCLPYEYDPLADCPNFLQWLREAVGEDDDIVKTIRAIMHVLVVGGYKIQFFVHIKGLAGTGKSTFIRFLTEMIGEQNVVSSDFDRMKTSRFEFTRIAGKRMLDIGEVPSRNEFRYLLQLSGYDKVPVEYKGGNKPQNVVFDGVTFLTGNSHLVIPPKFAGAMARRNITIDFNNVISKDKLSEWIQQGGEEKILHSEIPGVLQWILGMSPEEVKETLTNPPESILRANKKADVIGNGMSEWINEFLLPVDPETVEKQVFVHIGSGRTSMRDGVTKYGTNPEEDEKTKLFPSYLAFCREKRYQHPVVENFVEQVCITANRIFGVNFIHQPMSKKNPLKPAKRDGYPYVANIRLLTEDELAE